MINYFTFDGVDSRDFNTFIATSNMFDAPEENVETIHIPYKNTPLHISEKTFKPFILKALCYIPDNMQNNIDELRNFLKSRFASCRYTEALRPGEFRIARFKSAFEVERSDRQTAAFVLTFECAPQRYIIDNPTLTLSSTLSEETSYSLSTPAMPLPLTLEGNTTQGANPSPSSPQAIHSVSGDNEIKVINKNLFDIENDYVNTKFSLSGGTLFNTATDTRTYFFLSILALNGNTVVSVIYANSFSTTGEKSVTFNSGDLSNVTRLRLKHNGSSNDLEIAYVEKSSLMANTSYTLSFNLISNNPTTVNGLIIGNFQLEVGSTATSYEPYKAQVYPINLPVENQISTDYSAFTVGSNYAQYLTRGDTVTLSLTDKDTSVDISGIYVGMFKSLADSTAGYYWAVSNGSVQAKKYTTSQYKYFTIYPKDENTCARIFARFDVQVEVGSVANHYTPYGISPIELNALSTYKDYIHKENGKWYLHKEFDKVDMGTIEWATETTYLAGMFRTGTGSTPSVPLFAGAMACPIFIWQEGAVDFRNLKDGYMAVTNSADLPIVRVRNSIYSSYTNAQFKTAMSGTVMYYVLKTPTETEITDATLVSQLNAISKAKTYDGSTTIVQEGTDAQFKLSMPVPTEISSEYFGEPIITVNEVGTIVWNDSLIKVNSAPVTINSQTLQCYYYSENKNNDVEINEFPKYEQGENYIGSTMALTVVPNYWKL